MKKQSSLKLMLVVSFLAGCATMPKFGPLPLIKSEKDFKLSQTFKQNNIKWPSIKWWQYYKDEQLNKLISQALNNSPTLNEAKARVRGASSMLEQAESSLYPNVVANLNYSKFKQSYNQGFPPGAIPKGFNDDTSATLSLDYNFDFWDKNKSLIAASISSLRAEELEAEQAQISLIGAITALYADLAGLYANLDAANEALKVREQTVQLFKERFDKGLENEGSYEQALATKYSAMAEIESINEAINLNKNNIISLVGVGLDHKNEIIRPNINNLNPVGVPLNLPLELVGRRPDVAAMKYRVEAASKRIKAAQADFYPNIDLTALIGMQSIGLDTFTKSGSFVANVGPAISLPIFDSKRLKGKLSEKKAAYEEAVEGYNKVFLKALLDVANVITSQKALFTKMKNIELALASAEKSYNLINGRYKGGLTTYLEVLRAEDTLIMNKKSYADIKSLALKLDVSLIRSLGGGFDLKNKELKQGK